jgi:hypothetical protein
VYASVVLAAAGLLTIQAVMPQNYSLAQPYVYASFGITAVVSVLVIGLNRKSLDIGQTFPELLKIPLMRKLFT